MIVTILIFIIILGLLVFVHELGHFIVAKRAGMKVEEFGFGFPPRLVGIQKQNGRWRFGWRKAGHFDDTNTIYSINMIPLGGFVRILGENNEDEQNPQSFVNKPFFPRLLTLLAGVIMNALLAWALISIGYTIGLPVAVDDPSQIKRGSLTDTQVAIMEVVPQSPAAQAKLRPGDTIIAINDQTISELTAARDYIQQRKGETFTFKVNRFGQELSLPVTSLAEPPTGQGPTGIALAVTGTLRFPWYQAIGEGLKTTVIQLRAIATGLFDLITKGLGVESLGGPVKIAQLTGQVARLGVIHLLQFTAFLSLNLAILNSVPFPALDGGRVLFLIIEKIRGKKNNQKVEQIANTAGFALLLSLMFIITVKDISSLGGLGRIFEKLIGG
jgi:regulator of sigma E protease